MDYSLKHRNGGLLESATSEPFGSESRDAFVNTQQSMQT